jgi:GTP-binding protein
MPAEFVVSALTAAQFPKNRLPEVAFVGRSNVGKSSLLNTLLLRGRKRTDGAGSVDRKQLARTSRTPGRTRSINFYLVNRSFYFADLPGYGYAKVSRTAMLAWRRLAESYLLRRSPLRLVVLIVDMRHGGTALDEQMKDWLTAHEIPFLVVASKSDKLKATDRTRAIRALEQTFGSALPFSAKTAEGVPALWDGILAALNS